MTTPTTERDETERLIDEADAALTAAIQFGATGHAVPEFIRLAAHARSLRDEVAALRAVVAAARGVCSAGNDPLMDALWAYDHPDRKDEPR